MSVIRSAACRTEGAREAGAAGAGPRHGTQPGGRHPPKDRSRWPCYVASTGSALPAHRRDQVLAALSEIDQQSWGDHGMVGISSRRHRGSASRRTRAFRSPSRGGVSRRHPPADGPFSTSVPSPRTCRSITASGRAPGSRDRGRSRADPAVAKPRWQAVPAGRGTFGINHLKGFLCHTVRRAGRNMPLPASHRRRCSHWLARRRIHHPAAARPR
jgi:hypothetical protein